MRVLTPEQVLELVSCMNSQARCVTLIGALAGLRWGETAALRLKSLDLLRRRITVTNTLIEVEGQMVLGPPKTPKSQRSLTISKLLVSEIEGHLASGVKGHDGLVFTSLDCRLPGSGSIGEVTAKPTPPSTGSFSPACPAMRRLVRM